MSARVDRATFGFLLLAAPVLALPGVLSPGLQWMAAAVAMVAMGVSVFLLRGISRVAWCVVGLSFAGLVGWVIATDYLETINHFCGLALGLLLMSHVTVWSRTRERLAVAVIAFLVLGVTALAVGSRSTAPVHTAKALFGDTTLRSGPAAPLPLSGLHAHTAVSRNALAAAAMMVLPVAAAVLMSPARWFAFSGALRLLGGLTTLGAVVVVVLMQSRSAWLSAVVLAWLWSRAFLRRRWWWAAAVLCVVLPAGLVFVWGDHPRALEVIGTLRARVDIWQEGLQALRTSPWLGIGFDYFRHSGYSPVFVFPDRIVGRPHAHNILLQTALDIGLVGLAVYLTLIVLVLKRAWQVAMRPGQDSWVRAVGVAAGLSLVSVHVYGLLDAVPLGAKVGLFQWFACGLILAAWRMQVPADPNQAPR